MNLSTLDKNYTYSFCYPKDKQGRIVTQCTIYKVIHVFNGEDVPVLIGTGKVTCSKHDNFNKVVGRKLAFTEALKEAGLDKPTRTFFWNHYKDNHRFIA